MQPAVETAAEEASAPRPLRRVRVPWGLPDSSRPELPFRPHSKLLSRRFHSGPRTPPAAPGFAPSSTSSTASSTVASDFNSRLPTSAICSMDGLARSIPASPGCLPPEPLHSSLRPSSVSWLPIQASVPVSSQLSGPGLSGLVPHSPSRPNTE